MSENKIKVKGESDLARDPNTKAILNTNKRAWAKHKERKAKSSEKQNEVNALRSEVAELKEILAGIINTLNKPKKSSK
jgi:uncharacterized protein YecT (DUF1311 family)|tara:strand:+ start:2188 stop:2421 length:234 start_codon:yes stop_codon:yes gene_type:complete